MHRDSMIHLSIPCLLHELVLFGCSQELQCEFFHVFQFDGLRCPVMYPKLFVFNHRHFGLSLENRACSLFKPIAKKLVTLAYLGIVMHLVDVSCVLIAFFSSSSPPVFFNFFTKLFTAFSDHLSTSELSPFFHPSKVFTIGGVKGDRVVILFLVKTHFNTTVTQILAISTHCLLFLHSRVVYLFFHRMRT